MSGPLPIEPALLPPDESSAHALLVVLGVGSAVSFFFVVLRIWSRLAVSRKLGWDDGVVVVGWCLNISSVACCIMAVKSGLGRHLVLLKEQELSMTLYYATILQPMGVYSYCFPKLAIVALIIKLILPGKPLKYSLWGLMAILFITSFLAFLFLFVQCDPPDHFWHPLEPADCMPSRVLTSLTAIAGSSSAISDFVLAVIPIKVIFGLQMKLGRKIGISVLMGLGLGAMVAAIVKTSMLHKNSSPDATYELIPLLIAHYIEVDLVFICATAPFIPALYTKYFGTNRTQAPSYPRDPTQTFGQSGSKGYRPFESQESAIGLQHRMGSAKQSCPSDQISS